MLSEADLAQLPVRVKATRSRIRDDIWVARAGLTMRRGSETHALLGFGSARDEASALESARWELFERLLMCAEVTGSVDRPVPGFDEQGRVVLRPFTAVVARSWHGRFQEGQDATGIAVHSTFQRARDVARDELVERSAAARVWYGHRPLPNPDKVRNHGSDLNSWSWRLTESWFSLAAFGPQQEVFTCGAAVRTDLSASEAHAVEEAVMIASSVINGEQPQYHQHSKNERFISLRGPKARARAQHLSSRLGNSCEGVIVDDVRIRAAAVTYHLVDWPSVHLVRAVSSNGLPLMTARSADLGVVDDPFV